MNAVAPTKWSIAMFEAGDIDPEQFTHEAHVHVGWLYVREFGVSEAISRFDAALRQLVTKLGAVDKYHATLTWFFLLLIAERIDGDEPWQLFKNRNMDLLASKKILSRFYQITDLNG